jgi:NAD(P)-dependent dehydrogenase (short-subunit alcohol dehydrogenase family)
MTPSTAIITGAASGIGRACVLRCVEQSPVRSYRTPS